MRASLAEERVGEKTSTQLLSNLTALASTLSDPFVLLYRLPISDLRKKLEASPSLASANDHGRNLMRAAAVEWDLPRMSLLLEFGADVEAKDVGGHNALYRVANGIGSEDEGRAAIELLIRHGADVNQVSGVGDMTPLHMSARRGTTVIAQALLDAGASVEARDKNGETPLRRAVNCAQEHMVSLLLNRGANPTTPDKNGRTPLDAAQKDNIRKLFVA